MASIFNDLLTTPAHAQAAGGGLLSGDGIMAVLPYVAMFGIFYFLLIRPQQVKQKQLRSQLSALRRGDRVLTAGGIIGVVQKVSAESNEVEVEIAQGVRVSVLRDTISSVITSAATPANDSTPEKAAKKG
ncbi:preprotein translocase subunit YajC [Komagataeibacter nataicola]|uniref:Sec translocon accessory complex subunit YajC n=1 Tax=Komagataeibacter nataicola TaxID=265960 RepID=A0A9N7H1H5_9PROT|nr:preprotein translocase subunit YajC [Komagataeibacter nataicola]AQU88214.1 preprotein translocase subunit YajC [Komagataeibacter nataicola]PYD67730.1 preprotein translocase subunit YajC [Komagataeibacter nataicola]WEQ54683.1 preprotein translocase subunit YajC [Komagataeibacter nataicola]WNM09048.1 preprotein translocase subunit YajC [Komagataeibacter nataicola]GBR14137.1 protein translocase subunit YajC [Komagataeibacter nataicola NRIC 0616]